ncbi:M23 family metallopeptidase [Paenalkalicoccus suaedae]|uniref:M23 family metallopeptidase n=2 Tax=Paenalkalicoccus suaedae TaxID=2592382 RepID=A0A859FKD0_9BACI|nr:M23 family metallopeptidase [Paenalkalicoccus suaedae]
MNLALLSVLLLAACSNANDQVETNDTAETNNEESIPSDNNSTDEDISILPVTDMNGESFIPVASLMNELDGDYTYDEINKVLTVQLDNQTYEFIYEVPVVEANDIYLPLDSVYFEEDDNGEVYLTTAFLTDVLELSVEEEADQVSFAIAAEDREVWESEDQDRIVLDETTPEEMIDYLSFLQTPIEGATVSTIESHLPGAPRDYRNGFHEGIDWYDFSSGVEVTINRDTPVLAMADGVIVRIDNDYEEYPSPEVRNEDLAEAAELGFTPSYIFDRLRGMQVWVQYEDGVMIRFAHLDAIPEGFEVGDTVTSETVIGFVGNSGTSGAVNQDDSELHLHKDLLIYGELFWEPYTLDETLHIIDTLWGL